MSRVVVTGLGVISPNAIGIDEFTSALKKSRSGIDFIPALNDANFNCQVGGIPAVTNAIKQKYFTPREISKINNSGLIYGIMAGIDAWEDAGLKKTAKNDTIPDWDSGCFFGVGSSGLEMLKQGIDTMDSGSVRKLGSRFVQRTMTSGISAHLGGILGLGNQVSTNSSACNTGTEAILMSYNRIKFGQATRMLAGGCDGHSPYVWGGFDAMLVLNGESNHDPTKASRPLSASAKGFVPGSGAGALVLESLKSAQDRGANIYAEILGGHINSGGQRGKGTMTFPNPIGTEACIRKALENANVSASEVSAISGHLTGTKGDIMEITAWAQALDRKGPDFPFVNSLKSLIGHCLGGAGSIECVAVALQLYNDFFHASVNCEDLDQEIASKISEDNIPKESMIDTGFEVIAKASFGFGDVNSTIIFKKWEQNNHGRNVDQKIL